MKPNITKEEIRRIIFQSPLVCYMTNAEIDYMVLEIHTRANKNNNFKEEK